MQVRFAQKSAFKTVKAFARMEVLTKNIHFKSDSDDPRQVCDEYIHICNTHVCVYDFCDVYIIRRCSPRIFTSPAVASDLGRCVLHVFVYIYNNL